MASPKKARKPRARRPLLLRRAMLHSSLCFLLGLLAGLAPAARWTASASAHVSRALHAVDGAFDRTLLLLRQQQRQLRDGRVHVAVLPSPSPGPPALEPLRQPQLLLVVTATERSDPERRAAGLTRAAHALRLVPPPVLWLVVEPAAEALPTARLLRGAGVAYRHLTYGKNFTDGEAEVERHHQRNLALEHVEEHRLGGVVLFAGLGDVYDLRFFDQLRQIRAHACADHALLSMLCTLCFSAPSVGRNMDGRMIGAFNRFEPDAGRVAGGDGVGARAEGDGGRPGVRRLAVGGHRLVLHGRRRGGADGEGREAAGRHGGRGALRVRQRPALAPQPVGQLPRLRARRLTGFRKVCATVGRTGLQQVEGDAQPGLLGGHGVARRSVPRSLVSAR